jgi:hypothetical protein
VRALSDIMSDVEPLSFVDDPEDAARVKVVQTLAAGERAPAATEILTSSQRRMVLEGTRSHARAADAWHR